HPRAGGQLRKIAAAPEAHVGALTFTRVLLESMAAVLVTLILTEVFAEPWQAFLVAVLIMMIASFVLTGASPRSVGRTRPAAMLRSSAWLARVVRVVMGPLAQLLVNVGDRVTPGRSSRAGSLRSEEHLLSMVDEAAELEVLDDEDRDRIHSAFAFGDRIVREVMVARTDMITADAKLTTGEAVAMFLDEGISRAPVTGRDGDDVRGVLYFKDLVAWYLDEDKPVATVEGLARPADFVPETMPADDLLARMQRTSTHFAMIVDEYGGIAGLVTLEDLIEELVGDINDEYDQDDEAAEPLGHDAYRVPSQFTTDELGALFDLEIDDEDVDTVGGLIGKELGKIPKRGDVAIVAGLRLEAERIGRRARVTTVIVRRATAEDGNSERDGQAGRHETDD
ncbi:MAG: hemolysin family protein, partial [Pseudoclavibacter sp.]